VIELPEQGPIAGRLHVDTDGEATLVVDSMPTAPDKDYEIWVIEGETPRPAGVFDGGRRIVRLSRPVPPGASVAVTLERNGGVQRPTTQPLFVVET
jgi:anti-sigma-K factor RskA